MNSHSLARLATAVVTIVVGFSTLALAGPPLVCHPIAIGQAKTLPWVDLNYQKGSGSYNLKNLPQDTLEILDSNPSVLVRMETLRRATIYARQDPDVARELLLRLKMRTTNSNSRESDALAWFDLGYLAETIKQSTRNGEPSAAKGLDGYVMVNKAISLRGSDPEMEFAAALIAITGSESDRKLHVEKAIAGAKSDPLLAQNLAAFFNHQTIAEMLTQSATEQASK